MTTRIADRLLVVVAALTSAWSSLAAWPSVTLAQASSRGGAIVMPRTPGVASVAVTPVQVPIVSVADLPLNEVPAGPGGRLFAVFLTGDGGWAALDKGVTEVLAARGVPTVGFNTRTYLWTAKTPDQAGADLGRIIAAYRAKWHRDSVVVIGYSRGAGIAPFAVNRLPAALRASVKSVVLIGAEHGAGFHFRMRDLLTSGSSGADVPVMPELRKLGATSLVCFYGEGESDTLCPELALPAIVVKMSGGHHLDGAYGEIGKRIADLVLR